MPLSTHFRGEEQVYPQTTALRQKHRDDTKNVAHVPLKREGTGEKNKYTTTRKGTSSSVRVFFVVVSFIHGLDKDSNTRALSGDNSVRLGFFLSYFSGTLIFGYLTTLWNVDNQLGYIQGL